MCPGKIVWANISDTKGKEDMTIATNELMTGNARTMRNLFLRFALAGAFAGLATFVAQEADARGGGLRGGGISAPRGGGGLGRAGGLKRPSGVTGQRPATAKGQRPTGSNGVASDTGVAGSRNANTGVVGNRSANTGVIGSGNGSTAAVGNGNTGIVNTGNVVAGNDVDVNVDNGWGGNWNGDQRAGAAYATGVAVGASTTAALIGSYYSTLPAGCVPYVWSSGYYYSCGNSWYRPTNSNGSTVYVVVSDPRH
jgi:hypothetical protein